MSVGTSAKDLDLRKTELESLVVAPNILSISNNLRLMNMALNDTLKANPSLTTIIVCKIWELAICWFLHPLVL